MPINDEMQSMMEDITPLHTSSNIPVSADSLSMDSSYLEMLAVVEHRGNNKWSITYLSPGTDDIEALNMLKSLIAKSVRCPVPKVQYQVDQKTNLRDASIKSVRYPLLEKIQKALSKHAPFLLKLNPGSIHVVRVREQLRIKTEAVPNIYPS
ncbi:hypothetical protein FOMPIDRAFT_1056815 [Fomitopsis schrenkii]|uniref:Uncharacterized protein n=1 Tax=Fomitopsis schrenkii TaxID=2126942 RepID=S8ERS4_FOMSC|nr:hypothetical protein FOMPIDRAFT_1056815 [Fomitopsis schrenkii]